MGRHGLELSSLSSGTYRLRTPIVPTIQPSNHPQSQVATTVFALEAQVTSSHPDLLDDSNMLTPSLITPTTPLYAIGNTPAVSLTRSLPQGIDADILLLGCGDVRHILYTAYSEQGFRKFHPRLQCPSHCHRSTSRTDSHLLSLPAARKIDVTCCDVQEHIIGT